MKLYDILKKDAKFGKEFLESKNVEFNYKWFLKNGEQIGFVEVTYNEKKRRVYDNGLIEGRNDIIDLLLDYVWSGKNYSKEKGLRPNNIVLKIFNERLK